MNIGSAVMALCALGFLLLMLFGVGKLSEMQELKEAKQKRERDLNKIRQPGSSSKLNELASNGGATINVNVNGTVNERLRMAQVKCIQCGASIEPGMKFCSHCGTQIPDDAFRAEININDPAKLAAVRAQARIEEAKLRNQQIVAKAEARRVEAMAKKELARQREKKLKRIGGLISIIASVIVIVICIAADAALLGGFVGVIGIGGGLGLLLISLCDV